MLGITTSNVEKIPYVRFDEAKRLVSEKYNRKIRNPFDLEPEEEELIGKYLKKNMMPILYLSPIIRQRKDRCMQWMTRQMTDIP